MLNSSFNKTRNCAVAGFATAISGRKTVEMHENSTTTGMVSIGAFSSTESAEVGVKRACGLDEKSPFNPIDFSKYLPAITHTVHFFDCTAPEKDKT